MRTDVPSSPRPGSSTPRRGRRLLRWLGIVVVSAVLVAVAVAGGAYLKLKNNVRHIEVTPGDLGETRPPKTPTSAVNVLVVGSDARDGANARYGPHITGRRTDTIMLAHLSRERDNAVVISFPRDSLVRLPACRAKDGLPGQRPHVGMINESYAAGGITCTWKTIEELTGIRIDHFVTVDFTGFKEMVDAVGGVEVCLPEPIHDEKALLDLPAGRQVLTGEQALGYVRARYSLGDGSDIGRIHRQQMFIASMAKKVMSGRTLTDPARLFGLLDAVTRSVTTDPELTIGVMKDLAMSAEGLTAGRIRFVTVPWRYSVRHPGRVEWVRPQAEKLFRMVASDESLDGSGVRGGRNRIPRSQVYVEVRDGTGRAGLATRVAADLEQRGYHVVKIVEDTREPYEKTVISYSPARDAGVLTLAGDLKTGDPEPDDQARTSRLVLRIGKDWEGVRKPRTGDDEAIKGFDATQDSCTATAAD